MLPVYAAVAMVNPLLPLIKTLPKLSVNSLFATLASICKVELASQVIVGRVPPEALCMYVPPLPQNTVPVGVKVVAVACLS